MGGKDPNRQPKLHSLRDTPPGWIRLATSTQCQRQAMLPVDALIRKHGDLALIEFSLLGLVCSQCGNRGATASMVRLCSPGCPRRALGGVSFPTT